MHYLSCDQTLELVLYLGNSLKTSWNCEVSLGRVARINVVEKCKVTCVWPNCEALMALHKHPNKQQELRWIMCRHLLYISTSSLYLTECPSHLLSYIDFISVFLPLKRPWRQNVHVSQLKVRIKRNAGSRKNNVHSGDVILDWLPHYGPQLCLHLRYGIHPHTWNPLWIFHTFLYV